MIMVHYLTIIYTIYILYIYIVFYIIYIIIYIYYLLYYIYIFILKDFTFTFICLIDLSNFNFHNCFLFVYYSFSESVDLFGKKGIPLIDAFQMYPRLLGVDEVCKHSYIFSNSSIQPGHERFVITGVGNSCYGPYSLFFYI